MPARKPQHLFLWSDKTPQLYHTNACLDIPVWEYKKRYARYNLRPLIMINGKYIWGSHSVMKSGIIWSGSHFEGVLPADLKLPTIQKVFESKKKLIEDALEEKTLGKYVNIYFEK